MHIEIREKVDQQPNGDRDTQRHDSSSLESLRAIVARSQTDELGTSKVIDMRNLAATVLTAYDKRSA